MTIRAKIKKTIELLCDETKQFIVYKDVIQHLKITNFINVEEEYDGHFNELVFTKTHIVPFIPPAYIKQDNLIEYFKDYYI
jgi:hypothetical protein